MAPPVSSSTVSTARTDIVRVEPAFGDMLSYGQTMGIVANTLRWGGLALGPSDCGYALWALPNHPQAVRALDVVLDHGGTPIPLSVSSVHTAAAVIELRDIQLRLASEAWPGGLTLVTAARSPEAKRLARALHAGETLGVRVSRSHIERQVTADAGMPITSAAVRYPDGSVVTKYDDAEGIVLDRVAAAGLAGTPLVGVLFKGRFALPVHSTVAAVTDTITIHREGAYSKRDLVAMASRVAVHEYADAT